MFGWFRRKEQSKEVARDRLKLVLMQDRMALAPHTMEQMKDAVIVAISRFVEIDEKGLEFEWKGNERNKALVANIPVRSVRRSAKAID
ncbi:MAG: cell division topological specificity factor MinE [Bacillota bacterium]|nr:cell division topological specificity factor MinE [Candidatus Fermentithermobacillaceae bacterium]